MVMGRTRVVMMLMVVASSAVVGTMTDEERIKNPDGSTAAIIVTCNTCRADQKSAAQDTCLPGATDGFWDGQPCGDCLLKSNFGFHAVHAYDLQFTGHLNDSSGKPLTGQFVKIVEPNGWAFTSRTGEDGMFRIMVGATVARVGNTPVTKDLGTFTAKPKKGKEGAFAFYLLPEHFKPCSSIKPKKK